MRAAPIAQLRAQPRHVGVDRADIADIIDAPDGVKQLLARVNTAGACEELAQEIVFLEREFQRPSVQGDLVRLFIDGELVHMHGVPLARCLCTPQQSGDALHQHGGAKRLRHIIVRTGIEAHQLVEFLAAGGEHQNGDVGGLSDSAANLPAVALRHHHVEQQKRRVRVRTENGEGLLAVLRLQRRIALAAQKIADQAADMGLVVGDQNFLHRLHPPVFRVFLCLILAQPDGAYKRLHNPFTFWARGYNN